MSWLPNQPYQPYNQGQGQSQPTGGYGLNYQPTGQYQQQQPTGYGQLRPQATGYPQQQIPIATGYQSGFAPPQLNQATGYRPPMPPMPQMPMGNQNQFISAFQPAQNYQTNSFMAPSQMQFAAPQLNQQPGFAPQMPGGMQTQSGPESVSIPWSLSSDEKKKYDSIFRNWDTTGEGFIGGLVAQEVFGQAGLEKDDLMDIWNLADANDRGKLNIAEFQIAMGLIYRKLNGIPIPATLPPELAPSSSRDLDDSVGFLTNLLKNDKNTRATSDNFSNIGGQGSYAKQRSLHETASQPSKKDATVYRHNDSEASTYKSSSRHIDRDAIRYSGSDSPNSELDDVKKSLQNTRSLVEKSRDRDDEEEELRDELRDLKRRIERVHDDLEYNLRSGRRTASKDDEKRKLERELLKLEHEELPRLSRRMEEKERDKKRDKAKFALERDSRNNDSDRYSDRPRASRDDYDSRDADRGGYRRGSYEEEDRREYSKSSRTESPPPRARTPPPAPPIPAIKAASAPPPPSAPKPTAVVMSAEERTVHRQAEAARRVQERLRALGLAAPSTASVDTSVADRLERDRKEAAAKVAQADKEVATRESERQVKLERERSMNESTPPIQASIPAATLVDPEEVAIAEREAAMEKEKAARQARLRKLEKELAEAQEAEDNFIKNKAKFAAGSKAASKVPPPPPASRSRPSTSAIPSAAVIAAPVPVHTPIASPVAAVEPLPTQPINPPTILSPGKSNTNPFRRADGAPTPVVAPPSNPFFRIGAAAIAALPIVGPILTGSESAPVAAPAPVKKVVAPVSDDDWDVPKETEGSDSSDDEDGGIGNRHARQGLASALFGGLISAPVRSNSAQSNTPPTASPASTPVPRTFTAPVDDTPIVRPMALLGAIQGGLKLKKTQTKDRSTPSSAGAVIGDASAPISTYVAPPSPPPSPPAVLSPVVAPVFVPEPAVEKVDSKVSNRQSVDWYGAMASDAAAKEVDRLPAPVEEEEPEEELIKSSAVEEDPLEAVDLTKTQRSRSLYAYEGQRDEDLSFAENVVILAHPAKELDSPWWYGTIATSGVKGWLPASFIASIEKTELATALYDYSAASTDELSFAEGSTMSILSSVDESWYLAEKGDRIGLVPKSYVELQLSTPISNFVRLPRLSLEETPTKFAPTLSKSTIVEQASDDSEEEESDEESSAERELERSRVLQASGLVVRESGSPLRPHRAAPRRPAPSNPTRGSRSASVVSSSSADLVRKLEMENREEDAFDIWQRVMRELPALPDLSLELKPTVSKASSTSSTGTKPTSTRTTGSATSAFLSRVVTGMSRTASTDKIRPIIVSSPILGNGNDDRRGSTIMSGIGSTWSSLIDPSALEAVGSRERKRQEAIFELIMTESRFLEALQLLQGSFLPPLQSMLSEKAVTVIFANVEEILLFSVLLLSELEERQRTSRIYVDSIGDIVLGRVRGLEVFKRYCVNQSNAAKTLADLKQADSALRNLLDSLKINGLEFESFLLEPMQRLTRIPLLINQILRYTEPDHADFQALTRSLTIAESILVETNNNIRSQEDWIKILSLSETLEFDGVDGRLDLTEKTRFMGSRTIIKEGKGQKLKSKRDLNIYLFNDLLLFTEYRNGGREVIYRYPIPLEECSIKSHRDDATFSVTHRREAIHLRMSSSRQCKSWKEEIEKSRAVCLEILGVYS